MSEQQTLFSPPPVVESPPIQALEPGAVLLVDGHSLLFRAHYAFFRNPLTNSKGMNTSAVFGFLNMLLPVIKQGGFAYVVVAFDKSSDTFRRKLYSEYKANRSECPTEIIEQTPYARRLVQAMNLPVVESDDYEADDLLGTLAHRFRGPEHPVTILTGDRDILQLVDDHISVAMTRSGTKDMEEFHSVEDVVAKLGVIPARVPDLKGLQGDSSDNIPGVPGVGPKTAIKLLGEHDTLEGVFEAVPAMKKSKLKERLEEHRDMAFLSRELGRIVTDVEFDLELSQAHLGAFNADALRGLGKELELRRISDLIDGEAEQHAAPETSYHLITDEAGLRVMVDALRGCPVLAVDTETTSQHPMLAELVGVSLSGEAHAAYYVPVGHRGEGAEGQLSWEVVRETLKPLIGGETPVVGQNIAYDLLVLRRAGLELGPIACDTMVAAWVLDPSRRRYDLKRMASDHLSWTMKNFRDVVGKKATFAEVPVAEALDYAAGDADATLQLYQLFHPQLETQGLKELFTSLELPLVRLLGDMEETGIGIAPEVLTEIGEELKQEMASLEAQVHELAGENFNIKSPAQLSKVLFGSLGYEPIKKTKSGYSTDAEVLKQLEAFQGCKIAGLVHRHRHLAKLMGTYIETLPGQIHPETGRIHASFHLTSAATGRLASSDPNLQNIPVRSPEGRRIREAFRPAPGKQFVAADYSQIELRILAHMSGSKVLCTAFEEGGDVHRRTAAEVFGIPEEEVDSEQRSRAKAINFGLIFGQSAHGLSNQLLISRKEAQEFIDRYFERLPEVQNFLEQTKAKAREQGFVETLLGRRRFIPELKSSRAQARAFAERIAINTPIQGSAADLIKRAMLHVQETLRTAQSDAKLILQIHDELILECPEGDVEATRSLLKSVMEGAMKLAVPLVVSLSDGKTWAELK
jgi:DNA polymerase-1